MRIHQSILIVLVIALYTNMLIEFAIFFLCIILHELGHLFFVLIFKQKINHLSINIFGGELNCNLKGLSALQMFLINIGGIIVNIIILFFSKFFTPYYKNIIYYYNLLLIIFNALPIFPLDGYRLLEHFLNILKNPYWQFSIISCISFFSITCVLAYGVYMKSFGLILMGLFLLNKNIMRVRCRDKVIMKKIVGLFS